MYCLLCSHADVSLTVLLLQYLFFFFSSLTPFLELPIRDVVNCRYVLWDLITLLLESSRREPQVHRRDRSMSWWAEHSTRKVSEVNRDWGSFYWPLEDTIPRRCLMTRSSQPFAHCTINYGITSSTPAEESHEPGWVQQFHFMQKARDLLTNTRPSHKEEALIWSSSWHIAQMALSQDLLPFREDPRAPEFGFDKYHPTAFAELKITVATNKKDRGS